MKLFLISQTENNQSETYRGSVVCAEDKDIARNMHPGSGEPMDWSNTPSEWCSKPEFVEVKYIGESAVDIEKGVVLSDFKAG